MTVQVRIDFRMWDFVNLAMAHNSIPFVKGISISGLANDLETVAADLSGTHMTYGVVKQQPTPVPATFDELVG